jgi:hypothetical protein
VTLKQALEKNVLTIKEISESGSVSSLGRRKRFRR